MSQTTDSHPQAPLPQPQIVRTPDFRVVFANHIRMRIGLGELGLAFGLTDELAEGQVTQESMMVFLSPVAAKVLSLSLEASLRVYEEQFGPIEAPRASTPEDAQRMAQAVAEAVAPLVGRK